MVPLGPEWCPVAKIYRHINPATRVSRQTIMVDNVCSRGGSSTSGGSGKAGVFEVYWKKISLFMLKYLVFDIKITFNHSIFFIPKRPVTLAKIHLGPDL